MKMPKRSRAHELETLSKREFEKLVPSNWVVRDKTPDYGVDCEVEIFESSGMATGAFFNVQLKATESKEEKTALEVRVKASTCNYWRSLNDPVLIARYVEPEKTFYARWFHQFDMSAINEKSDAQDTFKLTFNSNDILTSIKISELAKDVGTIRSMRQGKLPNPLNVDVVSDLETVGTVTVARIVSDLNNTLGFDSEIRFRLTEELGFVSLVLGKSTLGIQIANIAGMSIGDDYSEYTPEAVEGLRATILVFLGASLCKAGFSRLGSELVSGNHHKSVICYNTSAALTVAEALVTSGESRILVILIKLMMKKPDVASEVTSSLLQFCFVRRHQISTMTHDLIFEITNWVLASKRSSGDDTGAARISYSYANFCRGFGNIRRAITFYRRAAKLDADYRNRGYFWFELAGALFESKHFRWSSSAYNHAKILDSNLTVDALLGDALFHDANFSGASKRFTESITSKSVEEEFLAEYLLKKVVSERLSKEYPSELTVRKRDDAIKLLTLALSQDDSKVRLDLLKKSVGSDPTYGLAWFNLGSAQNAEGLKEIAQDSFLYAALFMRTDTEAWAMAFLVGGFDNPDDVSPILIANAAQQLVGNDFKTMVIAKLEASLTGPSKSKRINELFKILDATSDTNKQRPVTIRSDGRNSLLRRIGNFLLRLVTIKFK
jgi:tetratricopeptide (TPR) repeat protein